jgi:hypothetical protein
MNKIAYPTMRYSTPGHAGHADAILMVSLPAVPGVTVTNDRAETDPKQPVIRHKRPTVRHHGVALMAAAQRRVEMFRQACREVMEGEE